MNRRLQWINLAGVFALAAICAMQWAAHRRLNRDIHQLEKSRTEQRLQIETLIRSSSGQTNDLESLRAHLARMSQELRNAEAKLAVSELQARQAVLERGQLKTSVTHWAAAATARDERIRQDAVHLEKLAQERNDAVKSFNDLAERHNLLVSNWNKLQAGLAERFKTNSGASR